VIISSRLESKKVERLNPTDTPSGPLKKRNSYGIDKMKQQIRFNAVFDDMA
jgi:hypothetical protein